MKRAKHLETLSWEHHDGLVVALRLKQGLEKQADLQSMSEFLLYVWDNDLKNHFWQEEKVLVEPLEKDDEGSALLRKMMADHREMEAIVEMIKNGKNVTSDTIAQFSEKLNRHIRFEERELFPFVEKLCAGEKLEKISLFLHENHKPACKSWKPEFWRNPDQ